MSLDDYIKEFEMLLIRSGIIELINNCPISYIFKIRDCTCCKSCNPYNSLEDVIKMAMKVKK